MLRCCIAATVEDVDERFRIVERRELQEQTAHWGAKVLLLGEKKLMTTV